MQSTTIPIHGTLRSENATYFSAVWEPPYTGGPGQTAPVAPPCRRNWRCKVQCGSSSHAGYLPSFYFLSLVYSELDNTQLVFNKQLYVHSWTFYWCLDDVELDQTVMRLHNDIMLFDLFIFLSWPSMWWTCAFTPTQPVSWRNGTYTHCPTFPLIGRHARFSEVVRHVLAPFPPLLISFLSFAMGMITHN